MNNLKRKIKNLINKIKRRNIIKSYKKQLNNKDFTLISSNCNGSFIMHDLGVKFNSPTINLFILPKDFNKFIKNLDEYLNYELLEVRDDNIKYPIGKLNDIYIYFKHYNNFNEAKEKWDIRKKRINKNNLFILSTDRDGCSYRDIEEFDNLPYKNKVIFTHKYYPHIKSAYYIKGFEKDKEVGILSCFEGMTGRRYLDQFDYISWFNNYES